MDVLKFKPAQMHLCSCSVWRISCLNTRSYISWRTSVYKSSSTPTFSARTANPIHMWIDVTSYFTRLHAETECCDACGCSNLCCAVLLPETPTCFLLFRFEEAVSKYEAVMKTEPNVAQFSLLAKERICHALTQVRRFTSASNLSLWFSENFYPSSTFWLCSDQDQQASRAVLVCSEVLQSDPENVNVLKDRAEAHIQDEQYEEGKPQH